MATKPKTAKESKFTKQQAYRSKKYKEKKDLIFALLEDDRSYTIEEIDQIIDKYLKREINNK